MLALTAVDLAEARQELEYAAPKLESLIRKPRPTTRHAQRRHALAHRALAQL
ncbi:MULTISPECIES: hypothetical protein [unclassified Kribbella]|uniref:hypothetical protein n=1 Tax=unclassified Kribbella TaxID=2644121 RepID=UPI0030159EE2